MKRMLIGILAFAALLLLLTAWLVLGSATRFQADHAYLEIPTGSNFQQVKVLLKETGVADRAGLLDLLAAKTGYNQKVKPGRYKIEKGTSLLNILRMLNNGSQEPVNYTVTKLRTREDLIRFTGKKFEFGEAGFRDFLLHPDSLRSFGVDTQTVMTLLLPDTYSYYWNTTPGKVLQKWKKAHEAYWTPDRVQAVAANGLNPTTAYILASIVEEETQNSAEKGKIASVYLNRLKKNMRLGADPTVKYALNDFSLKRIYHKHLTVESSYNTYRVFGLPPGPICTPSRSSLDAVVNAPKTEYLYFVAKADFSGTHQFAATYEEHLKYAKQYQQALNARQPGQKGKEDTGVESN
jgi:UPF0755 protein